MMTKKILPLLGAVCFAWFWSCSPYGSYSEIPEIHFKKLIFEDRWDTLDLKYVNKPVLTFSFVDGDGNLGGGSSSICYRWYEKNSDQPYQFPDGSIITTAAIPYSSVMDKTQAQNKTLKGTIEIELFKPRNPPGIDTMRVEFYIVDRAMNQSNIEYTPDFSILSPAGTELTK